MSVAPKWWTEELQHTFIKHAELAFPDEVCTLFYTIGIGAPIEMIHLPCHATPVSFQVEESALISFCYDVVDAGGVVQATGHSHPTGGARFSKADAQLARWAEWHALTYRDRVGRWRLLWGNSATGHA